MDGRQYRQAITSNDNNAFYQSFAKARTASRTPQDAPETSAIGTTGALTRTETVMGSPTSYTENAAVAPPRPPKPAQYESVSASDVSLSRASTGYSESSAVPTCPPGYHENIDPADFEHIMRLSRAQENAEVSGGQRKVEQEHTAPGGSGQEHVMIRQAKVIHEHGVVPERAVQEHAISPQDKSPSETNVWAVAGETLEAKSNVPPPQKSTRPTREEAVKNIMSAFQQHDAGKMRNVPVPASTSIVQESYMTKDAPPQTLNRQFVLFQQKEAKEFMESDDYASAERTIRNLLNEKSLTSTESEHWKLELAMCLQMSLKWQDSLDIIYDVWQRFTNQPAPALQGQTDVYESRILQMLAEAYFQLGHREEAKETCEQALSLLEPQSQTDADVQSDFFRCIELMVRISSALGNDMQMRFYKSKMVEGYVSKPALRQQQAVMEAAAEELRREQAKRNSAVLKRKDIASENNAILREYDLEYSWEEMRIIGSDKNFLNALDNAMNTHDQRLAKMLLSDISVLERKEYINELQLEEFYAWPYAIWRYRTALYYAIKYDNLEATKELFRRAGDQIHIEDDILGNDGTPKSWSWTTPLMLAAMNIPDGIEVASYLLQMGADPNEGEAYQTPLKNAALHKNKRVMQLLISAGAEVNPNTTEHSPLYALAISKSSWDYTAEAQLLIENGANIAFGDKIYGRTALHEAVCLNKIDMVYTLCKAGADLNVCDAKRWTPLDYAYVYRKERNNLAAMKVLYRYGGRYGEEPSLLSGKGYKFLKST